MNAKTTSQRVEKLRQEREALGLRRRELYAHDDDWPKLQELADVWSLLHTERAGRAAAVAAERERCARVCEDEARLWEVMAWGWRLKQGCAPHASGLWPKRIIQNYPRKDNP